MNEGVEVSSARLSRDHLAHLIKHRSFNLPFSFRRSQRTTSTSSCTTRYNRQQAHTHARTHTVDPGMFINDIQIQFSSKLLLLTDFVPCPPASPTFSFDTAERVSVHWSRLPVAAPPTVKPLTHSPAYGSSVRAMWLLQVSYILSEISVSTTKITSKKSRILSFCCSRAVI